MTPLFFALVALWIVAIAMTAANFRADQRLSVGWAMTAFRIALAAFAVSVAQVVFSL